MTRENLSRLALCDFTATTSSNFLWHSNGNPFLLRCRSQYTLAVAKPETIYHIKKLLQRRILFFFFFFFFLIILTFSTKWLALFVPLNRVRVLFRQLTSRLSTQLLVRDSYLSYVMRKPVSAICEQQRHRSACASSQSDQHFYCSLLG